MGRYDKFDEDIREAPVTTLNIWNPDPKGTLTGLVVSIRTIETRIGESDVIDIKDGSDEVFSVWISQVLRDKLETAQVRVGDVVGIRFDGLQESKTGKNYKNYTVKRYTEGPEHTDNPLFDPPLFSGEELPSVEDDVAASQV